jgi:hypothetical protein
MRNFAHRLWLKCAIVVATTIVVTAIGVPAHASKIGDGYIRYDCGGHPGAGIIRSDGEWNATRWANGPKALAQDKWAGKARGGHHYGCKSGCNAIVTGSR